LVSVFFALLGQIRAAELLPEGVPLLRGDATVAFTPAIVATASGKAAVDIVDAAGPGFDKAWRVRSGEGVVNIEDVELAAATGAAVEKDGVALLRLFMRTVSSADETAQGHVFVNVRKDGVDFNSSLIATLGAGKEWQEYLIPFRFIGDYPEKGAILRLRFGYPRQEVEVGGVELVYYGKSRALTDLPRTRFSYAGRESDAAWRRAALDRIERIRKGTLEIRAIDEFGKPLTDVKVSVHQTSSEFEFGSALQMKRLVTDSPDNRIYRKTVLELFNAASTENDLKWPVWLGEWEGGYDHANTVSGLNWLKANGLHLRGHVLVWPGWKNLPGIVRQLHDSGNDAAIMPVIYAHIRKMADVTRGLTEEWDVLNEPYTNHDLMDILGPEIMVQWFCQARAAMPGTRLFFNDFSNHDDVLDAAHVAHFEETARYLLGKGAPVDGLGLQAHISGQPNDPDRVLAVLDRYARMGLPIRFTEFDVRTEDEELQADYTRDFLILAYSHPSVIGLQFWGFWEGSHWIPVAAMYRQDWSEKPAAEVYKNLVLERWRTNGNGETAADGSFRLRAYQGDYVITAERDGRTVTKNVSVKSGCDATVLVLQF
jgi:GH35 family endo-1,4-beta-xylanase